MIDIKDFKNTRAYFDESIIMLKNILLGNSVDIEEVEKRFSSRIFHPSKRTNELALIFAKNYEFIKDNYSTFNNGQKEEFLDKLVFDIKELYRSNFGVRNDFVTNTYEAIRKDPFNEINNEF